MTPETERWQDQVCLDFWNGVIDRATAQSKLVILGLDSEIVAEGLEEMEDRKRRGLPLMPTRQELGI